MEGKGSREDLNNKEEKSFLFTGDYMDNLIVRYMDEETIRIFCFFLKNKYDPVDPVCMGCARKALCKRDAGKMLKFKGYVPWWKEEDSVKELIEKLHGKQRCSNCEF